MNEVSKKVAWESLTNIPFIYLGAYMFPDYSAWGAAIILMGIGSLYGHATQDFRLDWLGMWVAFSGQIGWQFGQMYGSEFFYEFTGILMGVFIYVMQEPIEAFSRMYKKNLFLPIHYILLGALYLTSAAQAFYVFGFWPALVSLLFFVAGFVVRQTIDHGAWHICIAFGILSLIVL